MKIRVATEPGGSLQIPGETDARCRLGVTRSDRNGFKIPIQTRMCSSAQHASRGGVVATGPSIAPATVPDIIRISALGLRKPHPPRGKFPNPAMRWRLNREQPPGSSSRLIQFQPTHGQKVNHNPPATILMRMRPMDGINGNNPPPARHQFRL